jgi:hypothetical protein
MYRFYSGHWQHFLNHRDLLQERHSQYQWMATPTEREEFDGISLGYTETFGAPDLRIGSIACQDAKIISAMETHAIRNKPL